MSSEADCASGFSITFQVWTVLLQVGSVHSYIPAQLESYLSKGDHLSYWEKTHLSGLEKYTERIKSLILPHLSSRCDVCHFYDHIERG